MGSQMSAAGRIEEDVGSTLRLDSTYRTTKDVFAVDRPHDAAAAEFPRNAGGEGGGGDKSDKIGELIRERAMAKGEASMEESERGRGGWRAAQLVRLRHRFRAAHVLLLRRRALERAGDASGFYRYSRQRRPVLSVLRACPSRCRWESEARGWNWMLRGKENTVFIKDNDPSPPPFSSRTRNLTLTFVPALPLVSSTQPRPTCCCTYILHHARACT